jgi:FKBP-type peptidyl-prolyl cis-trans isomerase FkpA
MKIAKIGFVVVALFATMFVSCKRAENKVEEVPQRDTLSYIIGLNVGQSLLKMDSTLNIESVCEAIRDVYNGTPKMSMEEARDYYLAEKTYFVHERAKAHQEQFLADLRKNNRQYVRSRKSDVTYRILKLGDQSHVGTMTARDTVEIVYTITNESGKELLKADTLRDSYKKLLSGLQEVVKEAGDGAHFNAWLPSSTAYGSEGNKEIGVGPNELLNFDVQIVDIKYNNNNKKKK